MRSAGVAFCVLAVLAAVHSAHALAGMRTVRRVPAVVEAAAAAPVAPAEAADSEKVEMVFAELRSDADEAEATTESAAAEEETSATADSEADTIHGHFRQYTVPMDEIEMVEVTSTSKEDEEGGADKGSNPTYILPVDPFNYFPFFNGFSNVNPFSQFYPPAPYLYPQYTNYMHQYANHGAGHPPGYPYPGAYGGAGAGAGPYGGAAHAGFPYNYPSPSPHMHYPFGAYKMDVSGPDVRTGSNNPPPFPQFSEVSSEVHHHLIRPEIIPKAELEAADESDVEAEGDSVIASFIQTGEAEEDSSDVEFEDESSAEEMDSSEVEFESDSEGEAEMAEDVEIMDESASGEADMSSDGVEFLSEEGDNQSDEVEYTA